MKNRKLILSAIILFAIANTSYFWESKISFFIIPLSFILLLIFVTIVVLTVREIYFSIKEKLSNKDRLLSIAFLIIILLSIFFKPFGIVDFEKFEGKDLLVARSEGAVNCLLTLKLKDDNVFTEKSVCFGVSKINGNYKIKHDTIFFDTNDSSYAKFAVLKNSKFENDKKIYLFKYKSLKDTLGDELTVISNKIVIKPN